MGVAAACGCAAESLQLCTVSSEVACEMITCAQHAVWSGCSCSIRQQTPVSRMLSAVEEHDSGMLPT